MPDTLRKTVQAFEESWPRSSVTVQRGIRKRSKMQMGEMPLWDR